MATPEEIRLGFHGLMNDVTCIPVEDIMAEKSFVADFKLDSLAMVEIALAVQERFGIRIADEDLVKFHTVGDAVAYLEQALT